MFLLCTNSLFRRYLRLGFLHNLSLCLSSRVNNSRFTYLQVSSSSAFSSSNFFSAYSTLRLFVFSISQTLVLIFFLFFLNIGKLNIVSQSFQSGRNRTFSTRFGGERNAFERYNSVRMCVCVCVCVCLWLCVASRWTNSAVSQTRRNHPHECRRIIYCSSDGTSEFLKIVLRERRCLIDDIALVFTKLCIDQCGIIENEMRYKKKIKNKRYARKKKNY